jgi:hypothetical protein
MGTVILIAAIVAIAVLLIVRYYPPLGGKASRESKRRIEASPQSRDRKFENQIPTSMNMDFRTGLKVFVDMIKGHPQSRPKQPLETERLTPDRLSAGGDAAVTWFGHSAVLLKLDGKTLFLDPMLGRVPSPFPMLGGRRYSCRSRSTSFRRSTQWSSLTTTTTIWITARSRSFAAKSADLSCRSA